MLVFMLHVKLVCVNFILPCDIVVGNVIVFVIEVVGFCWLLFALQCFVANVLLFVLEVNQSYARYLLHCNVIFGNVIVFVLK